MIINYTPHAVNILNEDNRILSIFSPSGVCCRVKQYEEKVEELNGIDIVRVTYGETENLPPRIDGVRYIVSTVVGYANPDREDLLIPNNLVRYPSGDIRGCRSLKRNG